MVMTVNLESRAVTSANGAMLRSVEMRFALKDITMIEHMMVFTVKKTFRTQ